MRGPTTIALAAALAAALLAGCAGGGKSSALPQPSASGTPVTQQLRTATVSIRIPAANAATQSLRSASAVRSSSTRSPQYVSGLTQGIAIYAYASNTPQPATPSFVGDISQSSGLCTTNPDGSRTCPLQVEAPIGQDTFTVSTYDQVPVNGVPQGNLLSTDSVIFTVVAGQTNVLPLVLNGVPVTVVLSPAGYLLPAGQSATFTFTVEAKDADGSTIIGPGYYNTPIGLSISGDPSATLSLSTTLVTSPAGNVVTATFNGGSLSGTATITGATSGATNGTLTVAANGNVPQVTVVVPGPITEFALPNGHGARYIIAGTDGNVWFTDFGGSDIGRITPNGTVTLFPTSSGSQNLEGLTIGPDGNIWYDEQDTQRIGRMTLTGTVLGEYSVAPYKPLDITTDTAYGTGVWFADNVTGVVVNVTASGTIAGAYGFGATSQPHSMLIGPQGSLWFALGVPGALVTMQPLSPQGCTPAPCTAGTTQAILTAPANISTGGLSVVGGNIWFTEGVPNSVGQYIWGQPFLSSNLSYYGVPTAGSQPQFSTAGPDGQLWFGETAGNKIGAFNPATDQFTEYPIPTAGSAPTSLVAGPDGNIWFVESQSGKIGRVQL